ncbi:hypothetical protein MRB53_040622 [Persea americana]|nr:hypothetical protein MRB53_040622 [Persea americana]
MAEKKDQPWDHVEFLTVTDTLGTVRTSSAEDQTPSDLQTDRGNSFTTSNHDRFAAHCATFDGHASEVHAANHAERQMSLIDAVRLYPKAVGWSILLSMTIVMEGYGGALINSFFAFPSFQRDFGVGTANWGKSDTRALADRGWITDHIGYRKTIHFSLIAFCGFIFIAFFAKNTATLLVAQILSGLPWGVFQTLSTAYAADVMPVNLRAYLTSTVNMFWLIGQVISLGVVRGFINNTTVWSYRIPWSLQWAFAVPLVVAVSFAPESPWWLVRKGRYNDARTSLLRLTRRGDTALNVDETITLMRQTNAVEEHAQGNSGTSYFDCFRGTDLRRTEIACMVWAIQNLSGGSLTGYAVYFFVQAGFAARRAFTLSVGMYGLAIVGGIISWILMRYCGRRTLYLAGTVGCVAVLLVGGFVGVKTASEATTWTLGGVIVLLTFVYDMTIGPVCYSLVAEIPSTRLRSKTVVLARIAYNICSIISNVLLPKMLSPEGWNWRGKSCFVWAGTGFACAVWCWYRLPEPKGLTYIELDLLFEKKVNAKKFHKVQANLAESGYFSIGNGQRKSVWATA